MRTYTFVDSEGKRIQVTASSEAVARQKIQLYYSARGGTEGQTFTLTDDTADFGRRGGDILLPGTFGSELDQVTGDGGSGSGSTLPEDEDANAGEFSSIFTEESFPANVFGEALRGVGLDPNRSGQRFLDQLLGPTAGAIDLNQTFGLSTSPFAQFTQQTLGSGGLQGLAGAGLAGLQAASQVGSNTPFRQFVDPESLGTNEARSVQNAAQAALLSRLSPFVASRFAPSLVQEAANLYGNAVARGESPGNFAQHFINTLRL